MTGWPGGWSRFSENVDISLVFEAFVSGQRDGFEHVDMSLVLEDVLDAEDVTDGSGEKTQCGSVLNMLIFQCSRSFLGSGRRHGWIRREDSSWSRFEHVAISLVLKPCLDPEDATDGSGGCRGFKNVDVSLVLDVCLIWRTSRI